MTFFAKNTRLLLADLFLDRAVSSFRVVSLMKHGGSNEGNDHTYTFFTVSHKRTIFRFSIFFLRFELLHKDLRVFFNKK